MWRLSALSLCTLVAISNSLLMVTALVASPRGVRCFQTAFAQNSCRQHSNDIQFARGSSNDGHAQRHNSAAMKTFMSNDDDRERDPKDAPGTELDPRRPDKNFPAFLDAMLEIPDPRMLAGDLLSILIINFLLQIANEVSDPEFWMNGGFGQPVTMPTTLLGVIVQDSKMSIAWVLGALWNRSYSSASVADDRTAVKTALQVWVDYCSIRILFELGGSFLITHSTINIWLLAREAWYTAIVMAFFRLAYSRVKIF